MPIAAARSSGRCTIREVFQNIVDNAIKYTNDGQVMVRLTGDASITQIQVQDSGAGIPPEDIPHLFQKFYRVDNSTTRTVGGTGLGLFICRKITELYNGRIWVESQFGKGSTFFINLPRLNAEQALEIQRKQAATISPMDRPI
jgi:signal transduction histidine kinase